MPSSVPTANVMAAVETIRAATGMRLNTVVMGRGLKHNSYPPGRAGADLLRRLEADRQLGRPGAALGRGAGPCGSRDLCRRGQHASGCLRQASGDPLHSSRLNQPLRVLLQLQLQSVRHVPWTSRPTTTATRSPGSIRWKAWLDAEIARASEARGASLMLSVGSITTAAPW